MKFLTCETTFGSYLCVLTESYSTRDGHMRNYNNNNYLVRLLDLY